MDERIPQWVEFLRQTQRKRLAHCTGVANTAFALAKRNGADPEAAYVAGLLHDCAKGLPQSRQEELAATWPGTLDLADFPHLYHAPAGAALARDEWNLPEEITNAIGRHAPAQAGYTLLDKIIYIADKIEPARTFRNVDRLRRLIEYDFHNGLLCVIADECAAIMHHRHPVHPAMIAGWNEYLLP
ncbi:MAG: bis(5'-nucleosyl)-tetraphosphatase (symmetrical) YqeK [Clostridia bacterium]|nr:bis(5'-nucleosyl)-tetraphosphatase (symmetrical) YqeK [Clostridia bacterium]